MTKKEKQDYIEISKILDDIDEKHEREIEERVRKGELIWVSPFGKGDHYNKGDYCNESIRTLMIKAFIAECKDRIDMSKIKEVKDIINFFSSDEFDKLEKENI